MPFWLTYRISVSKIVCKLEDIISYNSNGKISIRDIINPMLDGSQSTLSKEPTIFLFRLAFGD